MSEFQPDLLGGAGRPGRRTPKIRRNARPAVRAEGHAAPPGTGPAGETCGSCHWLTDYRFRKLYHKCGARAGDQWKGGRATDIGTLDAACSKWQPASNFVRAVPAGTAALQAFIAETPPVMVSICMGATGGGKTDRSNANVRGAVLALIAASPNGLTADECATRLGLDPHSLRPRVTELSKAGAIEKTGARRSTASGGTAAVWKARGGA